jgi:hypothetical protein
VFFAPAKLNEPSGQGSSGFDPGMEATWSGGKAFARSWAKKGSLHDLFKTAR